MSLLFAGCPIHEGEISVEEKCFNCKYFLGKQFIFYTVDRWCSHPEITKRLGKMKVIMIDEEIKEKTIKWISLEAEVMTKIQEMIKDKKIDKNDWHSFLKKIVKEYGTIDMLKNLERQLSLLEFLGQIIKTEREEVKNSGRE